MSPQEALLEPRPKTAILPLLLRLSPRLRLPLPLQLLLRSPTRGFSNSLWKPTWRTRTRTRPRLPLQSKQSLESNRWRPSSPTFIMGTLTWTAIAFVSSVRTTLIPPELAGPIASHSPPCCSVRLLYSVGTNINVALRGPQWHGPNSRASSERTWEMIGLLLTASVVNSNKTLSTKPNLCWIGLLT